MTASGLSTTTGSPTPIAACAKETCDAFAVATTTESYRSAFDHTSSGCASTRASGRAARACACRSGLPVATAAMRSPGTAAMTGAWKVDPARP